MSLRSGQQETTTAPESPGAAEREAPRPGLRHPVGYLRARDPGLVTVKRSVLAAVVVPAIFAVARAITSNAQVPLFAAFGAFALMLFVSIPGTRSDKLRHYLGLIAAGALLIVVGSLCSNDAVLAIAGMGVAAFVVLFAGVLSPTAALGSTYLLLAFVLPVNVPVPARRDPGPPRRVGAGRGRGPAGHPARLDPALVRHPPGRPGHGGGAGGQTRAGSRGRPPRRAGPRRRGKRTA